MGLLNKNDKCFILHGEMMTYIHLAYSEAFAVQLHNRWLLKLVDGVPDGGTLPHSEKGVCRVVGPDYTSE